MWEKSYRKVLSNFNYSLDTANSLKHKIYKVIIPCATPYTRTAEPCKQKKKSKFHRSWAWKLMQQIQRWTILPFPIPLLTPTPSSQVWNNATQFSFWKKSFSSPAHGKDIARSSLRPMGTPLQTSWHSATPQTRSLWSVFPAALSVTVWLVLLRSPSPASFRCHLFCTRWLLPSNPTLPSYLAPGYHPYPKVLTQVLTAGRVRVSLLLLWQVQGCL